MIGQVDIAHRLLEQGADHDIVDEELGDCL